MNLPTVHYSMPAAEYHAALGASNSRLGWLARSPAHMRAREQQPLDTDALRLGSALHAAVLEPELFARQYVRDVEGDGRTKAVKAARAELRQTFRHEDILRPYEFDQVVAMRDSILGHRRARAFLGGEGANELSLFWRDDNAGVDCKARFDRHSPALAGGVVVDVKTTKDASPAAFRRSIHTFGYHRQAAMYLGGARAVGLDAEHFVLIAVEKEPPYAVAVYRVDDEAVEVGERVLRRLLARYAECLEADEWPAYGEDVIEIGLPEWAYVQAAREADLEAA